jgi:hypothetical protein
MLFWRNPAYLFKDAAGGIGTVRFRHSGETKAACVLSNVPVETFRGVAHFRPAKVIAEHLAL